LLAPSLDVFLSHHSALRTRNAGCPFDIVPLFTLLSDGARCLFQNVHTKLSLIKLKNPMGFFLLCAVGCRDEAHMKMNLQHYYKTLHGPKADPVELNLWTVIPMSTTARAMLDGLDPEADGVDDQTHTAGLY
jgi:hypothetical protein